MTPFTCLQKEFGAIHVDKANKVSEMVKQHDAPTRCCCCVQKEDMNMVALYVVYAFIITVHTFLGVL